MSLNRISDLLRYASTSSLHCRTGVQSEIDGPMCKVGFGHISTNCSVCFYPSKQGYVLSYIGIVNHSTVHSLSHPLYNMRLKTNETHESRLLLARVSKHEVILHPLCMPHRSRLFILVLHCSQSSYISFYLHLFM